MKKILPDQIVVFWGKGKGMRSLSQIIVNVLFRRCKTWLVLYQTLSKSFDSILSTRECAFSKSLTYYFNSVLQSRHQSVSVFWQRLRTETLTGFLPTVQKHLRWCVQFLARVMMVTTLILNFTFCLQPKLRPTPHRYILYTRAKNWSGFWRSWV